MKFLGGKTSPALVRHGTASGRYAQGTGLSKETTGRNFAEQLLNNRLQMACFGATEEFVMLTKQTKIGPCEQVKVN